MKRKRLAELVKEEALREAPEGTPAPQEEGPGESRTPPERPLPPYLTYVRKEKDFFR
ncbi:hypothetical protein [Meiothermus sp. QL-1]|uniref:hypothetical protein n=1 Tax=Meiothermus sp. QL-1 TaxID=2058095 RepID=UPI0013143458|nr:hypothetical protein [Meiothermus sp. QL-1]